MQRVYTFFLRKFMWFVLIPITLFSSLYGLGTHPLADWDESRYGQNAIEMIESGQWFHYSYDGKPDLWNAKPALGVWAIALSYKIFGFNAWALRLPSALAGLITCFLMTFLALRFVNERVALLVLFILSTSSGVFGFHTGRTGDFDALLTMNICGASCCWILREMEGKQRYAYFAALFLGFGFLAKGVAVLSVVPGLAVFSAVKRFVAQKKSSGQHATFLQRLKAFLGQKDQRHDLGCVSLFLCFPVLWFAAQELFRPPGTPTVFHGYSKPWEVMLFYDLWTCLTENIEGHGANWNLTYVFDQLDVYFSPWAYLLYLAAISSLLLLYFKARKETLNLAFVEALFTDRKKVLLTLSFFCTVPLLVLLTLARSKLPWYIAPAIPFLSLSLAIMVCFFFGRFGRYEKNRKIFATFVALTSIVAFIAGARTVRKVVLPKSDHGVASTIEQLDQYLKNQDAFCAGGPLRQSHRLALSFARAELKSNFFKPTLAQSIAHPADWPQQDASLNNRWHFKDLRNQPSNCVVVWSGP